MISEMESRTKELPLNLRVLRGPLPEASSRLILNEYNQQTASRIPFDEFIHWTQNGPMGPALHGILENLEGEIVGHQCLLPMAARFGEQQLVVAKSEYTFLYEKYRVTPIRGFESSRRPTHLIASRVLLEQGEASGWGPMLICTLPFLNRWARTVGCHAMDVPVVECLLILKPWEAAKNTLNLAPWQRAALGISGMAQAAGWRPALLLAGGKGGLQRIPIDQECRERKANGALLYFRDSESLRWRYPSEQYEKIAIDKDSEDYLIVKSGSRDGYLRVCQWSLSSEVPSAHLLLSLIRHAEQRKALGVRWAVYGSSEQARHMVSKMRKFGFLCANRVRTLLIRSAEERLLDAGSWNLNDSMFSFHH